MSKRAKRILMRVVTDTRATVPTLAEPAFDLPGRGV
jgi:hypothetical protein